MTKTKDTVPFKKHLKIIAAEVGAKVSGLMQIDVEEEDIPAHLDGVYKNEETKIAFIDFALDSKYFSDIRN